MWDTTSSQSRKRYTGGKVGEHGELLGDEDQRDAVPAPGAKLVVDDLPPFGSSCSHHHLVRLESPLHLFRNRGYLGDHVLGARTVGSALIRRSGAGEPETRHERYGTLDARERCRSVLRPEWRWPSFRIIARRPGGRGRRHPRHRPPRAVLGALPTGNAVSGLAIIVAPAATHVRRSMLPLLHTVDGSQWPVGNQKKACRCPYAS
jgi:hypothetical protein